RVGHARWRHTATASAAEPVLLETTAGLQPYPFPLAGTPSRPAGGLLEAFEALARAAAGEDEAASSFGATFDPTLLARLEGAASRAAGRAQKLERELEELADPTQARALGDLILARYADIPRGATRARLTAFD